MTFAAKYFLGLLFGIVGGFAFRFVTPLLAQAQSTPPFTATFLNLQQDADGRETIHETITLARRADGVTVERRDSINGQVSGLRNIIDLNSSSRKVVDPLTESVTTYTSVEPAFARKVPSTAACRPVGVPEKILGVDAARTDTTTLIGGREIRRAQWIAAGLGCVSIKTSEELLQKGSILSRSSSTLISIDIGEPATELFTVPPNYTERSPSQVMAEYAKRKSVACPTCLQSGVTAMDQSYFKQNGK